MKDIYKLRLKIILASNNIAYIFKTPDGNIYCVKVQNYNQQLVRGWFTEDKLAFVIKPKKRK